MPPSIRGAIPEYLARFFAGYFREMEDVITVGTSATELVVEDSERIGLAIVNFGTSSVTVAPNGRVGLSRGIILLSGGGALTLNVFQDGGLPGRPWHAISSVINQTVYVLQFRRDTVATDPTQRQTPNRGA